MSPPPEQADLAGLPPAWSKENTVDYLNRYPLPTSFSWPGQDGKPITVCPSYTIKHGYGKWLHDTPYYPGLFAAVHDVLVSFGEGLPTEAELLAALEQRKAARLKTSSSAPLSPK